MIVLTKSQEKSADSERKIPIWDDAISDGKSRSQELLFAQGIRPEKEKEWRSQHGINSAMDSFPISPADLPWWGWLLCAAGCWTIAVLARFVLDDYLGDMAEVLGFLGTAAGVFCALMGIARFVNFG